MSLADLHKLIDQWYEEERQPKEEASPESSPSASLSPEVKKELPKDKRVVRTKTSGDTVFLIDEVKKTRQRIVGSQQVPGPDIVGGLGFSMNDVGEEDDTKMMTYQMGPPIYRIDGPA